MLTAIVSCVAAVAIAAAPADKVKSAALGPLVRTVDLNLGEEKPVRLCDGTTVRVKLLDIKERRDSVRNALREAILTLQLDGRPVTISSSTYHLPKTFGRVQVDCPITKGYVQKNENPWSLDRDARIRLWPKGSPWIRPGTFRYPVDQRWFASHTLMANQIADGERIKGKRVYYHWGLDFGGAEGLVDILAATDGTVVSVAGKLLGKGPYPEMLKPRHDVVYLRDDRGWYYRYSHLHSIDPAIKLGARVTMGQKLGVLGQKGASGGWSHLHFDLNRPQPSGRYGIDGAYAFVWQAYQREHPTPLVAVARPHQLAYPGERVTLDAGRSYSALGQEQLRYEWTLTDGTKADGAKVVHRYQRVGNYREIVRITDPAGRVDYDFARVIVLPREDPRKRPPNVHATYWPTFGIKAGRRVTFKVVTRELRPDEGKEIWDFGDGSPTVKTQSNPKKRRYAVTSHVYEKPGGYLVSVQRKNRRGEMGIDRLYVRVEPR